MKIPIPRLRVILVTIVAVFSLIFLIMLYGVTYDYISSTLKTSNKLMHAVEVELELERLMSQLKYAEATQRGFIITNDSSFLTEFIETNAHISSSFLTLRSYFDKNPVQIQYLELLENTVTERYDMLIATIEKSRQRVFISDEVKKNLEYGNDLLNSSLNIVNEMILYQDENMTVYRKKHIQSILKTPIIYFTIVLITLIIFTFLLIKINKERKKLIQANEELIITNQSFAQAEELAGLSYWRYNFQDGTTTYSDNFYSILGLTSRVKDISIRYFLKMVHPADREDIINVFRGALMNYQPFVITYRIQAKKDSIKHIKSIGKIINDYNNQKYLIGINMDITELVISNKQLELKNRKLELFNADLASFNYVASHDLQAPLRKIQMFISRLNEVEMHNLSKQGKDYFKRIHAAAAHMQVLINDLLMFSRTNAGNKKFELTNLNEILNNAKDELIISIEEKDAEIISSNLPVVYAIPYQLQQLFINIIGNSLKFTAEGIKPVINIDCEIVTKESIGTDEESLADNFYKITFSDNGIGFENQYTEKIFHLLFRLHDKSNYPGSGIGLAICKKIVENHSGFIKAWSEPDVGTKFFIYLPASPS